MFSTAGILMIFHLLMNVQYSKTGSPCLEGQDVFTSVKENSIMGEFIANLSIPEVTPAGQISLRISGEDADWFFLDGKTIKLNSSEDRVLDREVLGSVLMAAVTCLENSTNEYRVMVEILNENDNGPKFMGKTIQHLNISELTPLNTVVFTLQASDADGDTIMYSIDRSLPDAEYFRVDLPNSGHILLNKPLDYENQTQLQLRVFAVEMNTKEHLNTTVTLTISVLDEDDHYPQFLPCNLLSLSQGTRVCGNPLYTTNITESDQNIVLEFSPGPVKAMDGDRGLQTPLTYSILSGADNGRFVIDSSTGEIQLTRAVENRLLTPTLRLRIMVAQKDDPKKYSVATAIVRVLAENRFPPQFERSEYRGFITDTTSPASLVITYGNELLVLQATDQDFTNEVNPKLQFSLASASQIFSVTQEGFLIARSNKLQPLQTHQLEVLASDLESGDVAKATISVDVLQRDQTVPQSPLGEENLLGNSTAGRAIGVTGVCVILLGVIVSILVHWARHRKQRQDPADRASVAQGKHPNVSLRWFQLVNHSRPMPLWDEVSFHNEAFGSYDTSHSVLHGKQGTYNAANQSRALSTDVTQSSTTPTVSQEDTGPGIRTNGRSTDKHRNKSVSFQDEVIVRDKEKEDDKDKSIRTCPPDKVTGIVTEQEQSSSCTKHDPQPESQRDVVTSQSNSYNSEIEQIHSGSQIVEADETRPNPTELNSIPDLQLLQPTDTDLEEKFWPNRNKLSNAQSNTEPETEVHQAATDNSTQTTKQTPETTRTSDSSADVD
ncbi:cadherin-related family member 5 isoform X2 [Denticeps clupeoides]|uniref:cadherin-related family member 5 isoform X2 n=1 Tax=Denticeps clupeoides TaxID=299321 RepID=UPI0010A46191|nr:cadherin-related family member 5-like isoform X2 [Denticeps clupeoides]